MRLGTVKNLVGAALVGLHLVAIFLCFYWLKGKLSAQDFRLTILILSPVTAMYAVAYVREVLRNINPAGEDAEDKELVRTRFAVLSILFSAAFSVGIIYTLYDFSTGKAMSADDLKDQLALIETSLGVFFGLIIERLFGKQPPPTNNG
jgi:hypothetical protein